MPRRFVDISVALDDTIASDPPGHLPQIAYLDHRSTAADMASFFPGLDVGDLPGGRSFLVLATSSGVTGVDLARALRDMGCTAALGGDDDTSTQATWRGQPLWGNQPRAVPDAIGVYVRS